MGNYVAAEKGLGALSFMAEISPHQETESQWIEAPLFLPISEILSLTWEIVVNPDYTFLGIKTFYNLR